MAENVDNIEIAESAEVADVAEIAKIGEIACKPKITVLLSLLMWPKMSTIVKMPRLPR